MGATSYVGEWAATLRYEDVPERVHARTKAQILSVLGAIHAGRHSEAAGAGLETARTWGAGDEATVFVTGERLPRHQAIFANAIHSVAFDFDDYLFAGHTGHSAVCAALAYGELYGASGRDVLAAIAVGNEVGGRLGASLLFGPHNGQMWAYIHLLEGACVAGRFVELDAGRMTNAIGIAFTQPVYPLMPAFMGPDSKLLIPSSTTVEGVRAAELAARGWTGAPTILEDSQGFWRKFNQSHFGWMMSGLGEAWVSDSLTYKVVPGCAYIDPAVDALFEIRERFAADRGRPLGADDMDSIDVRCGMFTSGMESFSAMYRTPGRIPPISVNFSVALSFALIATTGGLRPEHLSHKYLDANVETLEAVASRVRLDHDTELDRVAARRSESGGFSLRALLSGESQTLDGLSFEGYTMAFPAEVTLRTTDGAEFVAAQEVPLGGSGRDWEETERLVREKFLTNFAGDPAKAQRAVEAVDRLEDVGDVRELAELLTP